MLQELKEILGIIKDLPHMVMWVLAGLLLYKITIIGSVYGVIKLAIERLYSFLTKEKPPQVITHQWDLQGLLINKETQSLLVGFLNEITHKENNRGTYLHAHHIIDVIKFYKMGKEKHEKENPTVSTNVFKV